MAPFARIPRFVGRSNLAVITLLILIVLTVISMHRNLKQKVEDQTNSPSQTVREQKRYKSIPALPTIDTLLTKSIVRIIIRTDL